MTPKMHILRLHRIERRKVMGTMRNKGCQFCGKEFSPITAHQMYCSNYCREENWRRKNLPERKEALKTTKKCKGCENEFRTSDSRKIFCSTECRWKYFNARRETTKSKKRMCPICGKMFVPMQKCGVGRLYCSARCKRASRYKKSGVYNYDESLGQKAVFEKAKKYKHFGNWWETLERDDFTCQYCGIKLYPSKWKSNGYRLIVHHKDCSGGSKTKNHDPDNLTTLCVKCHQLYHTKINLVIIDGEYFIDSEVLREMNIANVKVLKKSTKA